MLGNCCGVDRSGERWLKLMALPVHCAGHPQRRELPAVAAPGCRPEAAQLGGLALRVAVVPDAWRHGRGVHDVVLRGHLLHAPGRCGGLPCPSCH